MLFFCGISFLMWFLSNLVGEEGAKDSRGQGFKGLFYKDFISAFYILSISAMSFSRVPNSAFSIKSKSPANNICVSNSQTEP